MVIVGAGATRIPVRSLWLLLIYASDLLAQMRTTEREALLAGTRDNDLIDAIAEVLVHEVEQRLRRQLTVDYRTRAEDLTRVRGRIDHLRTTTSRLMEQGRIACRFDELGVDSPRNRFIATTLLHAAPVVQRADLARRCKSAAFQMHRLGVSAVAPSRAAMSTDRLAHHDAADRRMLDAAHLLRDMAVPQHESGDRLMPRLLDDEGKYRKLFEAAVRGFFSHSLRSDGWRVSSPHLHWTTPGDVVAHLPIMRTDTVLKHATTGRRIVVETKFTDSLVDRDGKTTVAAGYLYQLYAYLASQSGRGDDTLDESEGVLLFVKVERREVFDDEFRIQAHRIRFLSVDLSGEPADIRSRWLKCVDE